LQQAQHQASAIFMAHGSGPGASSRESLGMIYSSLQQQALLLSYIDVFHMMGWLFIFTAPLVMLMRKPKRDSDPSITVH